MGKTLYKRTLILAIGVFLLLATNAGSAIALMKSAQSASHVPDASTPLVGRFIVTQHAMEFAATPTNARIVR